MLRMFEKIGYFRICQLCVIWFGIMVYPSNSYTEVFLDRNRDPSDYFQSSDRYEKWDEDWENDWQEKEAAFDIRYNRVEGLYVGMRVNKEVLRRQYPLRPNLFGFWGYSFGAKELQYQVGLEKGFTQTHRFAIGGEYHRGIETPDRWIIPDLENSLAAFLIREDFHDFYHYEGGSIYMIQNIYNSISFTTGYNMNQLDSLNNNVSWSLFGGSKRFRENPAMSVGEIRSLFGKMMIDTRDSKKRPSHGWFVQLEVEHGGGIVEGDFSFDHFLCDIRRYQPLGYSDGFDFRLRVGTGNGQIPWHKNFYLGGVSTLRGFSYKAFPDGPMVMGGNRMILAQLEYRLYRQDLVEEIGFGFLELFNLILFTDVGWVDRVDPDLDLYEGFGSLAWNKFKCDIGAALTNSDGNIRIEIARRTDTGVKPYVFLFRINRPF